jgi:hypothetical protein
MSLEIPALAALIAALVAWVAVQNHQLAREKHKLDLFEKRFAVFRAAQVLLGRVQEDGGVRKLESILEYRRDTQVAAFLFGPDVESYLAKLDQKARDLWSIHATLERLPVGDERTNQALRENELAHDLISELPKLKTVFGSYLHFKS